MWMHLLTAFVELVKAIAWPSAFVIVALSFKPLLVSVLRLFVPRKIELEALGFKATIDAAEQQQSVAENPTTEKLPAARTLDPSSRLAVNILETRFRGELSNIEAERREPILVRALAHSPMRGSTSMRSRLSFKTKAPSRSSILGKIYWA
jgi:hypothetical protein